MKNNPVLYTQRDLPVFQNRMYDTAEEARLAPRGDVKLVEDQITGLVHNAAFEPAKVVYDAHYQNEQSFSKRFREHLDEVAGIVRDGLGEKELVEIGCGKGYFLEMLAKRSADILGFDPTYEGENPAIRKAFFDRTTGLNASGIILRHVLEHIQNPLEFLHQIALTNGGAGRIYIEVPCLDWIMTHRAWFDIFYEHVNYFRLSDFHRMFGKIVASGRIFSGQYLYVVAELGSLRPSKRDDNDPIRFPVDFEVPAGREARDAGPAVIWGGASKGVIFALLRAQAGNPIDRVIDINPAKQGRFLPATGLRVEAPEDVLPQLPRGTQIIVMNSNYMTEIRDIVGEAFNCAGIEYA